MTALQATPYRRKGSARPGGGGRLANRPVDGLRPERAQAPGANSARPGGGSGAAREALASRAFQSQRQFENLERGAVCKASCLVATDPEAHP